MIKEKKILCYTFGYLLLGLFICLIGISNVFAATYSSSDFTAQLYDNYGPNLSPVTTELINGWKGKIPSMQANTSGGAWGISSPISLIKDHTYTLTAKIEGTYGGNIILSTYNRIGIGSSLSSAVDRYQSDSNVNELYSKVLNDGETIQFAFTVESNASYIVFPFATSSSGSNWEFILNNIIISDLGTDSVTQDEINNSLNNQTNEINNSINNSTNIITGEIGNLGDDIKDSIKDTFENCRDSVNLINPTFGGPYMNGLNVSKNSDGTINITGTPSQSWSNIAEDIQQNLSNGVYTFSLNKPLPFTIGLRYTDNNNNSVDFYIVNGSTSSTQTLPGNFTLYKIYIENLDTSINYNITNLGLQLQAGSASSKFEKPGEEVCQNKIDETNDRLDNIGGALTDSSPTDMSGLGDSAGWLPAGPVDSILTLPLTMLTNLVSNLSNSCQSLSIELPFVKKNITLPCIKSLYDKMGVTGTLFTTAGLIASAFILFNYLLALYKWVDDTLTMRENTMPGYFDDNWGGGA